MDFFRNAFTKSRRQDDVELGVIDNSKSTDPRPPSSLFTFSVTHNREASQPSELDPTQQYRALMAVDTPDEIHSAKKKRNAGEDESDVAQKLRILSPRRSMASPNVRAVERVLRKEYESKGKEIVKGIEASANREITDARNAALEAGQKAENALQQAEEQIKAVNEDIRYYKGQHELALEAANQASDRAEQAEAKAREADARAKEAEAKAKGAEKKIGSAEAKAQEALARAKKAEQDAENANLAKDQALQAEEKARAAKRKAEEEMKRRVDEAEARAQEALKQVEKAKQEAKDACREKAQLEARIREDEDEELFLDSDDEQGPQDNRQVDMDVDAERLEVKTNKGKTRYIETGEHSEPEDEDMDSDSMRRRTNRRPRKTTPNEGGTAVSQAGDHKRRNVPPPQDFSRPKGGGGQGGVSVEMDAPAKKKRHPYRKKQQKIEEMFDQTDTDSGEEANSDLEEKNAKLYRHAPRRSFFRGTRSKGYDPRRAALKSTVRNLMNSLMGMKCNNDIVKVDLASREEVMAFEEDGTNPPALEPMRPFLDDRKIAATEWNNALSEMFLEHFTNVNDLELSESQQEKVVDAFETRLGSLREIRRRFEGKSPEECGDYKEQMNGVQRPSTRRDKLWRDRRQVCVDMSENSDGTKNKAWVLLLRIIDDLTMNGMSSDESDLDDDKRPIYRVRKRGWRAKAITEWMIIIDDFMNTTDGSGRIRAGNPPRKRVRRDDAPVSSRDPTVGCAKNYYRNEFLKNLNNRALKELKVAKERPIPTIKYQS